MSTDPIAPHVLDTFISSALKELGREAFLVQPGLRIVYLKEIMLGLSAAIARAEKLSAQIAAMGNSPCA